MRILIIPDTANWAIGSLCKAIIQHNPHLEFEFVPAHPRAIGDAVPGIRAALEKGVDLVHFHYWNSAIQLLELMPELRDPKLKKILTHHNHHRLTKRNWEDFQVVTEFTDWGVDVLKKIHQNVVKVTYGIDLERFSYIPDVPADAAVGYVGRVVPWKNLAEITRVSNELGYKVLGSGFVDKPDYWATVDKSNLEFHGGIGLTNVNPANMKDDLYKRMTCFVMYSTEEKESGTLPLLEAMARGVPVLATEQGMARELIKDGVNGLLFTPETFKEKLQLMMSDAGLRERLRKAAWQTIKNYPEQKMAREFAKLYYRTLYGVQPLISTIITSYNRPDQLLKAIISVDSQDYPAKEILVADDGSTDPRVSLVVSEAKKVIRTPIHFIRNLRKEGYGLAKMRNLALGEAFGSHIVIMQDRFVLEPGVLDVVARTTRGRTWCFGNKRLNGVVREKKDFVENFSWILKSELVNSGGFNERIDIYGGQTEELRRRFGKQGYAFTFCPEAVAEETASSHSAARRAEIWEAKLRLYKLFDHV